MPSLFNLISCYVRLSSIRRYFVLVGTALLSVLLLAGLFIFSIGIENFNALLENPGAPLTYSLWAGLVFVLLNIVNAIIGNWAYQYFAN